jgi:hypothetical protein
LRTPKIHILILVLCLLAISCAPEEVCDEDSVSELVASFKTEAEGTVSDTSFTALTVYGIREGQSIWLLYDSVNYSEILLPLDPHHDFSRFVFQVNDGTDTLTLTHSSEVYLISYSCGFGNLFTLDPDIQYGEGMFVKDTIINPLVNTSLEEVDTHIWLYF